VRDYWVVIVTDPDTGRERRFTFHVEPSDPEHRELAESKAAGDAWACWASATHHGFVARAEHVKRLAPIAVPVR
jgi:hypothetical protein